MVYEKLLQNSVKWNVSSWLNFVYCFQLMGSKSVPEMCGWHDSHNLSYPLTPQVKKFA